MQDTSASLALGPPHPKMEGRQVTGVLLVISVPRAPQCHCPVPWGITATQPGMVMSPTVCRVLQVVHISLWLCVFITNRFNNPLPNYTQERSITLCND